MKQQPKSRELWSVHLPGENKSQIVLITRPGRLTTSFRMVLDIGIVRGNAEKVKVNYFNDSLVSGQFIGVDKKERTFQNSVLKFRSLLGELA